MTKVLFYKIIIPVLAIGFIIVSFKFFGPNNTAIAKELIFQIKAAKNIGEGTKLYRELIEKVGPATAQDALLNSGLPFTGQTHLLNHTVGEYLYDKYGPSGLVRCKDYFLSSCYHGFIIMAIARGGMAEVVKTMEECRQSGPTNFTQCAHAVGHGFLASEGYSKLPEALKLCDQVNLPGGGFRLFNCYDGVFMENIWAVHEGEPSPDRWVKNDDPFYPCNDPRINQKYQLGCWSNQPALMYQLFNRDIKKVGLKCDQVASDENRNMCFDGLARQIHPMTAGKTFRVFELCALMPSFKWNNYCVSKIAEASYGVGDRDTPFEICANIHPTGKEECYGRIFSTMRAYKKDGEKPQKLCSKISDADFRKKCEESI